MLLVKRSPGVHVCSVCEESLEDCDWIYSCTECAFKLHERCLIPSSPPKRKRRKVRQQKLVVIDDDEDCEMKAEDEGDDEDFNPDLEFDDDSL